MSQATGREQVELEGLDTFAEQVKDFFKSAISKAYPKQDEDTEISSKQTGMYSFYLYTFYIYAFYICLKSL